MAARSLRGVSLKVAVGPQDRTWFAPQVVVDAGADLVDLASAEVLIWMGFNDADGLARALDSAPRVRWVQLPFAGVESYAARGMLDDGRLWTAGQGVYAEPLAEHALALGLATLRRLPQRVREARWGERFGTSLFDAPVTVLGGGGITAELIRLLAPMRCPVTVVRRRADVAVPGAVRTVGPDDLDGALAGAALVILALALTPGTTGIINADRLAAMDEGSMLVNVARGPHVVTDDLVDALRAERLGGAGLDVTDPEPLPDGHPLWTFPNVVVTPHTGADPEMTRPRLQARLAENLRRYQAGEPLIGVVDPAAGY